MIYLYYTKLVSFCQQFFSHNDKICDFSLQNETPKPCLSIKYSQKKCFCPTGQKHFLSALGDDLDLAETSLGKILSPAPVDVSVPMVSVLIISILISRFGYKIKLVSYTTVSANLMLREIGLSLFLASVGIKAGGNFINTVVEGDGLLYVLCGFLITIIPIICIGPVARLKYKMNYFTLMGMIAGTYTDPPALAYANQVAGNDAPALGYTTVYPLSMFLRIITAQVLILVLG